MDVQYFGDDFASEQLQDKFKNLIEKHENSFLGETANIKILPANEILKSSQEILKTTKDILQNSIGKK